MLNYREKRTVLILSIIAAALSIVACIPFGLAHLSRVEFLLKYIAFPIIVAILSIVIYNIKFNK